MNTVRIRRLDVRYRLPPSRREDSARLNQILRVVLDDALERALERAGVTPHEVICIRSLRVPLRLQLSLTDSALVLAWSLAISESIIRARNGQSLPNVVCYRSPAQTLFDLAVGVATDRFERLWAWRLARLWHGSQSPSESEAARALVLAFTEQPSFIAPLLATLAAQTSPALFARLLRKISIPQWLELARAALRAAGAPASWIEVTATPGVAETAIEARRMVAESPLARAVAQAPPYLTSALEFRRAFAALIMLEQEPVLLRAPAHARAVLAAASDAMHPETSHGEAPHKDERSAADGEDLKRRRLDPDVSLDFDTPIAITRSATTRFGGLLLLLRLIEELGLPDQILSCCGPRSPRFMLHQLALALIPADPDDAAALAFAGLPPNAVPPCREEEPPTAAERATIASFIDRIGDALKERLEEKAPIAFVCNRTARIVADPGWVDVILSLNEISTAIRRAGLDLDPGYLPWLGVVMRFVYE